MKKVLFFSLAAIAVLSCCNEADSIVVDGKDVSLYTIRNGDVTLQVTNFGARVTSIVTPDREGKKTNIVLGHKSLKEYVNPQGERFLGACVGPVANRISNASFQIDGQTYNTPVNDNGRNTLHGGFKGVDNLVWDVVDHTDTSVVFHLLHPDGFEGYPGNLDITMTYALTPADEFKISYLATTDKAAPVSLTHHPFFCLRGQGNGTIEDYRMYIKASRYIPTDTLCIPTGEIAPVQGTAYDFRTPHAIGQNIPADGYDHNWCIDKETDGVELVCRVDDPVSGRWVEVLSDQPGLQFYSGNFFNGKDFRASLALEAQQFPDAVNNPGFPSIILRPGEQYTQETIYRFGVKPVWEPAGNHIRTSWADEVSPSNVHPEYPRPQMIRKHWQSLNGLWEYAITAADSQKPRYKDGDILVPFCAESSLSGVGLEVGADKALWYRRVFTVPSSWKERVLLNFDAVDWKADVWINGDYLGVHTGGYTAFSFDITDHLKKGPQCVVVRVWDGTDNDMQPRGKQVSRPGGIWYTPVTGIWQSVWIEPVSEARITDYNCVWEDGTLKVTVDASASKVSVKLLEGGEGWDAENGKPGGEIASAQGAPGEALELKIPQPVLWSPEHPYLYALEIKALDSKDCVRGYTALRTCQEVRDAKGYRRLGLNGEPYFQFGPLDQGWWPDGLYTAPTDEALAFDIVKTKEWGFNFIRKHIKVEPARWYYHCDRLGMMVWQDMPSVADNTRGYWEQWKYGKSGMDYPLTEEAKATYYKEWGEIIAQLKKYPCIVVWVPFNEAWGQFETPKVVDFTKAQDPTRLINSASGGTSYLCGDILDSHNYPNPTMKFRSGGAQIDVLGEYGGIGLAIEGHLWKPENSWGYNGLRKDGADALEKYREFAIGEFLPHVQNGVSAGVYTQTTDVEVETNGLMTYDRKVIKMDTEKLREINLQVINAL